MPKDFENLFSRIKGRKVSFFGRIQSNFEFKKVTCCLYHSSTVRHSTVKGIKRRFRVTNNGRIQRPTNTTLHAGIYGIRVRSNDNASKRSSKV